MSKYGLLQGLSQGVAQAGQMWMSDAMARQKEERLQAIADKNYERARGDQIADQKTAAAQKVTDSAAAIKAQKGLLNYQRDLGKNDVMDIQEIDGNLVAISKTGEQKVLGEAKEEWDSPLGKMFSDRNQFEEGTPEYIEFTKAMSAAATKSSFNPFRVITGPDGLSQIPIQIDGVGTGTYTELKPSGNDSEDQIIDQVLQANPGQSRDWARQYAINIGKLGG